MKIWTLVLILSSTFSNALTISAHEAKIKTSYQAKALSEKISKADLEKDFRDFLSEARPNRVFGSSGHGKAREFIKKYLESIKTPNSKLNIFEFTPDVVSAGKMYEDDFNREIVQKIKKDDPNYKRWKDFTLSILNGLNEIKTIKGQNIVFEIKGSINPNEVIYLGANYDTLNHNPNTMKIEMTGNMPGADNNASGVIQLLNMAKLMSKLTPQKTIRFVFFDCEEFGFLGSKDYVENIVAKDSLKSLGHINLVMLGHDSKIKDTDKKFNNMKVYLRDPLTNKAGAEQDLAFLNEFTVVSSKNGPLVNFIPTANGMNSSSHIRFWEANIPSLCFTENWETDFNPRFHTSDDFLETLNMTTYYNSFKFILYSLLTYDNSLKK